MLCLHDLAQLTAGRLCFGPMPPRDGEWTAVRRIALDSRLVEPGDLFWRLPGYPVQTSCSSQHALLRGAAGVVVARSSVAPWPGTFCLEVADELAALVQLVAALEEKIPLETENLQILQLCDRTPAGITPANCGRPIGKRLRCRRKAA